MGALRHPNVLPLLGIVMGDEQFAVASERMANGNIEVSVRAHKDANRFGLVRSPQLLTTNLSC